MRQKEDADKVLPSLDYTVPRWKVHRDGGVALFDQHSRLARVSGDIPFMAFGVERFEE